MGYLETTYGSYRPNFIDSDVGLVLKTAQIPASLGAQDGDKVIVAAGTMYPANDATATGIVFEDVDVTLGDHAGSVLVAGRVYASQLTIADAAKTALEALGIKFVDAPAISRGYSVTYDADDGTGTPPTDSAEYIEGAVVTVLTDYPLTKDGYTQTGWSLTSGGDAVSEFNITADTTLYPVWTANA